MAFYLSIIITGAVFADHNIQALTVHAYSQEYPWTKSQYQGFIEHLSANSHSPVTIHTEYLDTKRLQYTPDYALSFSDYLKRKYTNYTPDVIYVTDDNGYSFARDHLLSLFPSTPVFFSGVNNLDIADEIASLPIKGVFEKKDISGNIELIEELARDKHNILVLGDGSNTYQAIEKELRQQLDTHDSIEASFLVSNNLEEIIRMLKGRNEKYLFLATIGSIHSENGELLSLNSIISRILQVTDMSIFSMEDAYLFDGVLGGLVTSGKEQGKSAARLALQYLQSNKINAIDNIFDSPNIYQFDKTVLQKQNIKLPPEIYRQALFYNIPPNFYEKYRTLIFIIFLILAITIFLMAGYQFRARRHLKQKNRKKELIQIERNERYQNAILQWSGISYETIEQAFQNATQISSSTLKIERVSVWLYNDSKDQIDCHALYSRSQGHITGLTLKRIDFPDYFDALDTARPLAIEDATTHPATACFTEIYLKPNQIRAMLDIPLYYNGQVAGVLCHEHTGSTRLWEDFEIDFASTMASMVSLSLEVSKRKKIEQGLEEEIENRTREAVEANAAKSTFLANMSHELRTPMHAIMSYAKLVMKSELDEKSLRFMQNIQTSANRLTTLLDDLLDLSKLESGKMELDTAEHDLVQIIQLHLNEVKSLLNNKQVAVKFDPQEQLTGCFDRKLIGQVITNLLSNAIKFSPEGSTIIIRAYAESRVLSDGQEDVLHLEVIDDGIGIPAAELEDIFDKFIQSSSTRTQSGGTGLGLPISREIISLHNGKIWAESPVEGNVGSTFHAVIPIDCKIA
ncbi:MAG: GAF domain-containing sensor histidine kinase [Gammaproteobacteria bacterium]|nr:GAF domain-containing sensor histidine kinase [Gammaproteobacteria bacterium]